ncbi:MAG: cupin domain-containing protein [Candidatus Dormibacteria bacterium]
MGGCGAGRAADPGRLIENPVSGERITILETAAETGGDHLTFEVRLRPQGRVPSGHIHPHQTETFSVLEGRMRFRRGLRVVSVGPGGSVTVPPGTFHSFLNPGPEAARMVVRSYPALRMEEVLRAGAELGRVRATGLGRLSWLLEVLAFLREYRAEVAAPLLPSWAVALAGALANATPRNTPERPRESPTGHVAAPEKGG